MRLSTLAHQHSPINLGSANIYVLDARDFGLRRTLSVRAGLSPLRRINELQYIRGELWANLWGDQRLAVTRALTLTLALALTLDLALAPTLALALTLTLMCGETSGRR
jgi:glutamine cyclotransferase